MKFILVNQTSSFPLGFEGRCSAKPWRQHHGEGSPCMGPQCCVEPRRASSVGPSMRGRAVQATDRPQYAARNGSDAVVNPSISSLSRRLLPELRLHGSARGQFAHTPGRTCLVGKAWPRMPQNISCRVKPFGLLDSFSRAELFVLCDIQI